MAKAEQRPDPATFQTGDFLWPKEPGAWVPYFTDPSAVARLRKATPEQAFAEERARWEKEKQDFLGGRRGRLKPEQQAFLETLTFEEFRAIYLGNALGPRAELGALGWPVYVGHVAVLNQKPGGKWEVIEAVPPKVQVVAYDDWLAGRPGQDLWHGRLKKYDQADRARVAVEANKHDKKPYELWNFNLNSDKGFYCSKLVWMAVYRMLKFATDDDPDPDRWIWYSPKQLMGSRHIDMLFRPGKYLR